MLSSFVKQTQNISYQYLCKRMLSTTKTNIKECKVSVVTGSTSGIGLGIAKRLANDGYSIMLNGRRDDIKTIAENMQQSLSTNVNNNQQILYHQANMNSHSEIKDLIDYTISSFGQIDVLVNNAGIQYVSPIQDFPIDKWNDVINIDLSSSFYAIRSILPYMISNGSGRIINIASIQGLIASPFKTAYVAAKHGVVGLTKAVALEVAEKNITCNAICPGFVDTPLVRNQLKSMAEARGITEEEVINNVILQNQPTKKFVQVEEIAATVSFLCNDDAKSINGAIIPIDGGAIVQ